MLKINYVDKIKIYLLILLGNPKGPIGKWTFKKLSPDIVRITKNSKNTVCYQYNRFK